MPKSPDQDRKNNLLRQVAVLSGIAVEMGVIIYLAARGGMWLDDYFQTDRRLFTAGCTILGVALSLWLVLRQVKRFQDL